MEELLILVDQHDQIIGTANKTQVHRDGMLHRAFSVFVFASDGRLLLQQRAAHKYHSGNLWTNTCCGHPRAGESTDAAAHRRLVEEMGFNCPLREVAATIYRLAVSDNLIEHEFNHIYTGLFDGAPAPDPFEAASWAWQEISDVQQRLRTQAGQYTAWFKEILAVFGTDCLALWQAQARSAAQ